jgi:ATP adenylyltransferase
MDFLYVLSLPDHGYFPLRRRLTDIIQFQICYSPALANKPKPEPQLGEEKKKPKNPFENPAKGLLVTSFILHNIVLNKFPVIPNHFILATKTFKKQTDALEISDFAAIMECFQAYQKDRIELFAFFNSGPMSGASQPHRHVQFLPVDRMRFGLENGASWDVMADLLLEDGNGSLSLPFVSVAQNISKESTPERLHEVYMELYEQAKGSWRECAKGSADGEGHDESMSYNLAITQRTMVLCPRISEGTIIKSAEGEEIGPVALNGTLLGGTLLVKSEEEWNAIRNEESQLKIVLEKIGLPKLSGTELSRNN